MASKRKVYVVGVGMTKFEKPGARDWDYPQMGAEAALKALRDANLSYKEVQAVTCGYVYGDTTCGQRSIYMVGMTGVPIYNVNNACSTGSTALYMARNFVAGGLHDCVLAMGFEKMGKGSLSYTFNDRTSPLDRHMNVIAETRGVENAPFAPQMFGAAGREHMEKYKTTKLQFAKIAWKNHKHSVHNPYAQFRQEYSLEQIMKSPTVYEPLTKLQCCPTSEGAGAAILCSEEFVRRHNLQGQAVEIAGMSLRTDFSSSFDEKSCIKMVGLDMTKAAAEDVYKQSNLTPKDVQVIELHDCFSANELLTYEGLGLCPVGKAGELVDKGDVTYGGRWVVNPSGGLISKGHPLGATGLAQCAELSWQLRRMAGARQVPNVTAALQHNIGLGGAVVVTMYKLGFPNEFVPYPAGKPNPAVEDVPIDIPKISLATSPSKKSEPKSNSNASAKSPVATVFAELAKKIAADPSLAAKVKGVYQFNVSGANGQQQWTVDLKNGGGSVKEGAAAGADCTITMKDSDFVDLMTGKLDAQSAFGQGKLKVSGNITFAMKLGEVIKSGAKAKL